jgi:hypothetical protein
VGKGSFSFKGRGRVSSVGSESKGISYMELEEGDGLSSSISSKVMGSLSLLFSCAGIGS